MAAEGDESLSRPSFAMPALGVAIAVAGAGMVVGLVLFAALRTVGPPGVIAPALAVGLLILLRLPALTMALLLVGVVLFEPADPGLLPTFNSFYVVVKASLTPVDILLFVGLGGLLLRFATEGRRPRLPEPLIGPLALLGLATVAGVITGYTAHADVSNGDLYHRAMNEAYLIFVPLLVVNALRDTSALRVFVAVAAALASFKGLSGAYSAISGTGTQLTEEAVSYLEPVANLVMLTLVLGSVVALVRRQRLPVWVMAGAPLALLALLLSYRRSFWIAAAFTLIVVVIVASRRRGRTVMVLGGVALALTFATVLTVGSSGPTTKPLVKRAQQLSPAGIEADKGDRYRTDERRNVIANIEEHPLTGIGLGVPWKVQYPLAESHDRTYAHFAVLWFWLAFGPLGALAYLALMGTGLWTATTIWRRHPDPIVQIGAIAAFGTILAVLIVELTATFTGIEPRFSIVLGAGFGWLAAAWRDLPPKRLSPSAP
jgi:O-antigen ligase